MRAQSYKELRPTWAPPGRGRPSRERLAGASLDQFAFTNLGAAGPGAATSAQANWSQMSAFRLQYVDALFKLEPAKQFAWRQSGGRQGAAQFAWPSGSARLLNNFAPSKPQLARHSRTHLIWWARDKSSRHGTGFVPGPVSTGGGAPQWPWTARAGPNFASDWVRSSGATWASAPAGGASDARATNLATGSS